MDIADLNAYSGGLLGLISSSGPVARIVVLILLFFSVLSWTIFLYKWRQLSSIENDGEKFLKVARDADSFKRLTPMYTDNPESPFYKLLAGAYKEVAMRQK